MNFTFGIVTGGNEDIWINQIIDSIEAQSILIYEIIIVGNSNVKRNRTIVIPFNESVKPMWITKKKNIITQFASYNNIVYLHDYIILGKDWYKGFLQYGENFKACMTRIIQPSGDRFRDWTLWAENSVLLGMKEKHCLLPYTMTNLSKHMYFSGAYWIAKKDLMLEFPLNEQLSWGQGEDVEWSKQVRSKYNFSINPYSYVQLLKYKDTVFTMINEEEYNRLKLL
jgi:hypothetical protein